MGVVQPGGWRLGLVVEGVVELEGAAVGAGIFSFFVFGFFLLGLIGGVGCGECGVVGCGGW